MDGLLLTVISGQMSGVVQRERTHTTDCHIHKTCPDQCIRNGIEPAMENKGEG